MEYREEVRKIGAEAAAAAHHAEAQMADQGLGNAYNRGDASGTGIGGSGFDDQRWGGVEGSSAGSQEDAPPSTTAPIPFPSSEPPPESPDQTAETEVDIPGAIPSATAISRFAADPYRAYARRSSIISHYRADSQTHSPVTSTTIIGDGAGVSYVLPARSRVPSSDALGALAASNTRSSSLVGGQPAAMPPQFLRTLSTVSISSLPAAEAARARGLAEAGANGKVEANGGHIGAADAPPSELPSGSAWGRSGHSGGGEQNSSASSYGSE